VRLRKLSENGAAGSSGRDKEEANVRNKGGNRLGGIQPKLSRLGKGGSSPL